MNLIANNDPSLAANGLNVLDIQQQQAPPTEEENEKEKSSSPLSTGGIIAVIVVPLGVILLGKWTEKESRSQSIVR